MVYSTADKVEIIEIFFNNDGCGNRTAQLFNDRHPDKHVNRKYVLELVGKFRETGSVLTKKREAPPAVVNNEAMQIVVLGQIHAKPRMSVRQLATATGLSKSCVHRILKSHQFHPYKFHLVQELNEDDYDRRLQFCEQLSDMLIATPRLLFNVCFSDECTFFLNGTVNRHNCRYWSDTNPRQFREVHTQCPEKINVWAGIFGDCLVGPFFLDGNLNANMYLDLLENAVYPRITQILENEDHYDENQLVFQQDGAPPHYAVNVRQYLDETFPGRWIGRRGPFMEWPPTSPDLSPLDFFLWGHLKTKVFATQPETVEVLRQRIVDECEVITPEILQHVRERFEHNLYSCMEAGGAQFEHLIN